jgi:hypothetical protein
MKTFMVWMEASKVERDVTHRFFNSIGGRSRAEVDDFIKRIKNINISEVPESGLEAAISNSGLNPGDAQELLNYIKTHKNSSLHEIIDIIVEKVKGNEVEKQDKVSSIKAALPPAQGLQPMPNPPNKQQNQPQAAGLPQF